MRCFYCIRDKWSYQFRGNNLRLKKEPSYEQIIKPLKSALVKNKDVKEVVFCGYGEPMLRIGILRRVAQYLKQNCYNVRINTNGHGNLIHKRNVLPELKGLIDSIYVSLNAENEKKYFEMNRPRFGIGTFKAVLNFIKLCRKYAPDVAVTTVKAPGVDLVKCKKIARSFGVKFIMRPYL